MEEALHYLDFDSQVRVLRSMQMRSFDDAYNSVSTIKSRINVVRTAKECGLTNNEELKTLACQFSDDEYCSTVMHLLAEELPVNVPEEYLEEGEYYLMIELVGMNSWSAEEVDQLVECPDYYGQDSSLIAFLNLLNFMVDDPDLWRNCIDSFEWPIDQGFSLKNKVGFDKQYLKRYLTRHGAPIEVYTTVMLTFFPPAENDLLSIFADDAECDPSQIIYDVTPESINSFRKQWKEAQKFTCQIEPAKQWIAQNPWFIQILGEGLVKSQNRPSVLDRLSAEQGWPV